MSFPNIFSSDKWKVTFSNIPSQNNTKIDMRYIDSYIKNLTLPDMSIEYSNSDFMDNTFKHSISRINNDLSQVGFEIMLSEHMENYFIFYNWFQMIRHGVSNKLKINDCVIDELIIEILDNQKRVVATVSFLNCVLSSIGGLSLTQGDSGEVSFPVLLNYHEIDFKPVIN